jgi:hypothetical protein
MPAQANARIIGYLAPSGYLEARFLKFSWTTRQSTGSSRPCPCRLQRLTWPARANRMTLVDPKRPHALVQGRRPLPRYIGHSTPPGSGQMSRPTEGCGVLRELRHLVGKRAQARVRESASPQGPWPSVRSPSTPAYCSDAKIWMSMRLFTRTGCEWAIAHEAAVTLIANRS